MLAAILGAGPIADAFFVALRLPNHFRAIFAEGAFNAAFVPAYSRIRMQGGPDPAKLFADRIFTLMVAVQVVLLAVALVFTPTVISVLAPGFNADPDRFALATELTRITFPYLLLVSLVTLYGGILNSIHRFATPAAAPILLNLSIMATLAARRILSDSWPCCRLGGIYRRHSRTGAGDGRCVAGGCAGELPQACARCRCAQIFPRTWPSNGRLRRRTACAVCRYHHCELPSRRRDLGAVLRRPHQSIADRRDRHRGRHRAAAGNVAPTCRRR